MSDTPEETAKAVQKSASLEKQALTEKFIVEKHPKFEKVEKHEHKEKPEKIEHKEKPEKFEHKEKPEKFEHKEKPEKHEHKEIKESLKIEQKEIKELTKVEFGEGPGKHIGKEKDGKEIFEGPQQGDPGGDPLAQRVAALEQSMSSVQHFITTGQRPDLSQGALTGEPDAKKR